ncbi:MAG: hypothetical protein AUI14_06220 [Actinobacteria bacterium 13_2_20CM_2_71_6]|nr:MAG: hypothetical protein AUI14_06220 [Actinobacteria bacterium 13_2_20CM_2_71_6]
MAHADAADVRDAYRTAMAATVDTVLRSGRFAPGDRVVNYCAGNGIESLAIARRVAPDGVVYAVDNDRHRLARLTVLLDKHRLTPVVRPWLGNAMAAAHPPAVPTHVTCLFGLHHLRDARLATRRWAGASSPATRLVTADWGPAWDPDIEERPVPVLPAVAQEWRQVRAVTVEFRLPATAPAARPVVLRTNANAVSASVVVRDWTGEAS